MYRYWRMRSWERLCYLGNNSPSVRRASGMENIPQSYGQVKFGKYQQVRHGESSELLVWSKMSTSFYQSGSMSEAPSTHQLHQHNQDAWELIKLETLTGCLFLQIFAVNYTQKYLYWCPSFQFFLHFLCEPPDFSLSFSDIVVKMKVLKLSRLLCYTLSFSQRLTLCTNF